MQNIYTNITLLDLISYFSILTLTMWLCFRIILFSKKGVIFSIAVSTIIFINIIVPIKMILYITELQRYNIQVAGFICIISITLVSIFKGKDVPRALTLLIFFIGGIIIATLVQYIFGYAQEFTKLLLENSLDVGGLVYLYSLDPPASYMDISKILNPVDTNSGGGSGNNSSGLARLVPPLDTTNTTNFGISLRYACEAIAELKPWRSSGNVSITIRDLGIKKNSPGHLLLCKVFPNDGSVTGRDSMFAQSLHAPNFNFSKLVVWSTREHGHSPGSSRITKIIRHAQN